MKRRASIKALTLGGLSAGVLLEACKTSADTDKATAFADPAANAGYDRFSDQIANDEALMAKTFFTPDEMAVISILADIIIPADEVSGSATEAGVPDFIEFMVKDKPEYQVPMRGGIRWLNVQSFKLFEKDFAGLSAEQRITIVDKIAYPAKAAPDMQQGVSFFNLMRNLTASGFYTTEMGWKDIGYKGNRPNQWNGVPKEVLDTYKLAYTEKDLKECLSFDTPANT